MLDDPYVTQKARGMDSVIIVSKAVNPWPRIDSESGSAPQCS